MPLYFASGKWHSTADDAWPNSTDPDRCMRCTEHAAINVDQLCSVCSADDPSWPAIPPGAESEFYAAVARTTIRIAQCRIVRIAPSQPGRAGSGASGPWRDGSDCGFGPSPGAA